ncbi:MAG: glycerol kinase GlpK [Gammaproteobacteria bacterium]|nr:glycerol kinase GlpK [Gammaproteobacteria bacterium]
MAFLLAIDQGTTSSRAIVFNAAGKRISLAQKELPQSYPKPGWVEHDPERIWQDTLEMARQAIAQAGLDAGRITALGITNQRETTVVWERKTGKPVFPAIVWQDRRTTDFCKRHLSAERDAWIAQKTGLLLDPYFSGTKIRWILDNVPGARARADRGELAFGTIDTWLLWKLTGGRQHATDATNASRTLLFDIVTQQWDAELMKFLDVPASLLPEVRDSAADYGRTDKSLFGAEIPVCGIAGDQQAATVGQACFSPGMIKSTYGTGCFLVLNTGETLTHSRTRLLSTVAYRLKGRTTYAMEGSIFIAGAAVQWLRDALHLIKQASETEDIAKRTPDTQGVYLVPAFTGLGAPYWDPEARGAILGLTRDAGIAHIVRAALESVCYQTRDLLAAMAQDAVAPTELRVDGGMVVNDWLTQFLADILKIPVVRPQTVETTALGAAFLAGLHAGVYGSLEQIAKLWQTERRFAPGMAAAQADALYEGWSAAVKRVRSS